MMSNSHEQKWTVSEARDSKMRNMSDSTLSDNTFIEENSTDDSRNGKLSDFSRTPPPAPHQSKTHSRSKQSTTQPSMSKSDVGTKLSDFEKHSLSTNFIETTKASTPSLDEINSDLSRKCSILQTKNSKLKSKIHEKSSVQGEISHLRNNLESQVLQNEQLRCQLQSLGQKMCQAENAFGKNDAEISALRENFQNNAPISYELENMKQFISRQNDILEQIQSEITKNSQKTNELAGESGNAIHNLATQIENIKFSTDRAFGEKDSKINHLGEMVNELSSNHHTTPHDYSDEKSHSPFPSQFAKFLDPSLSISDFHGTSSDANVDSWLYKVEKVATLRNYSPEETFEIAGLSLKSRAFDVFKEEGHTVDKTFQGLSKLLRRHFAPKKNRFYWSEKLNSIRQNQNESVTEYLFRFNQVLSGLNKVTPDLFKSEYLIDIFVRGLQPEIRKHTQLQQPTDFDDHVRVAKLVQRILKTPNNNSEPSTVYSVTRDTTNYASRTNNRFSNNSPSYNTQNNRSPRNFSRHNSNRNRYNNNFRRKPKPRYNNYNSHPSSYQSRNNWSKRQNFQKSSNFIPKHRRFNNFRHNNNSRGRGWSTSRRFSPRFTPPQDINSVNVSKNGDVLRFSTDKSDFEEHKTSDTCSVIENTCSVIDLFKSTSLKKQFSSNAISDKCNNIVGSPGSRAVVENNVIMCDTTTANITSVDKTSQGKFDVRFRQKSGNYIFTLEHSIEASGAMSKNNILTTEEKYPVQDSEHSDLSDEENSEIKNPPSYVKLPQCQIVLGERLCLQCTIDSGATCCLMSDTVMSKLNSLNLICIDPGFSQEKYNLRGASGASLEVISRASLIIALDSIQVKQYFLVVKNLRHPVLLGLDFLVGNKAVVDFYKQTMLLRDANLTIPLSIKSPSHFPSYANPIEMFPCEDLFVIKPFSSRFVDVSCFPCENDVFMCGTVMIDDRPCNKILSKLRVSPGISDMDKGSSRILLNNIGRDMIYLTRESAVAHAWPILSISQKLSHDNDVSVYNIHELWDENSFDVVDDFYYQFPENYESVGRVETVENSYSNTTTSSNGYITNLELSLQQNQSLIALLDEFSDIFCDNLSDLKPSNVGHHEIRSGSKGPVCLPPRRLPPKYRDEVNSKIKDMLAAGIIEECKSAWASAIVVTKRKSGKIRMVFDFRKLNELVTPDRFPLPVISHTLDLMSQSSWFSSYDLFSGYYQIKLAAKDRLKTAFRSSDGLYCFKTLPQGLRNASSTFQRVMTRILSKVLYRHTVVYLDDICVFSRTFSDHLKHLREVFKILRDAGLQCGRNKCKFAMNSLVFLGHKISGDGIQPDRTNIDKLKDYPTPKTVKDVRMFVGLVAFYKRFILKFSEHAAPLTDLTKKTVKFSWGEPEQKSFEHLRNCLISQPVLGFFDFEKTAILETDASKIAISGIISQENSLGEEHPIFYGSKKLDSKQSLWCTRMLEAWAIVYFTDYFRVFLISKKFIIRTDHSSLQWMLKTKKPEKMTRWAARLSEFEFEIHFRPGKMNNSDALSRVIFENEANVLSELVDLPDLENFRISQENDCLFGQIIRFLKGNTDQTPEVESFLKSVRGKLTISDDSGLLLFSRNNEPPRVVVPPPLRKNITSVFHDLPTSAHLGKTKTDGKMKTRFWWPNMVDFITAYINACIKCRLKKSHEPKSHGKLQLFPATRPFQCLHIDILGSFTKTFRGNRYILVQVCRFSRWPELVAMPDQTAITVADSMLESIICRHGVPETILSDRGTQFLSQLFRRLNKRLGLKTLTTSSHHPQTNSVAEKLNRFIANSLSILTSDDQRDWDNFLGCISLAYRVSVVEGVKHTPFSLVYGRTCTLPTDILYGNKQSISVDQDQYKLELTNRLRKSFEIARQTQQKFDLRKKEYYDSKHFDPPFEIGDQVLLRTPTAKIGLSKKLIPQYTGPHKILEKLSPVNYRIKYVKTGRIQKVHVQRILKYTPLPGIIEPGDTMINNTSKLTTVARPKIGQKHTSTKSTTKIATPPISKKIIRIIKERLSLGRKQYLADYGSAQEWISSENVPNNLKLSFLENAREKRRISRKHSVFLAHIKEFPEDRDINPDYGYSSGSEFERRRSSSHRSARNPTRTSAPIRTSSRRRGRSPRISRRAQKKKKKTWRSVSPEPRTPVCSRSRSPTRSRRGSPQLCSLTPKHSYRSATPVQSESGRSYRRSPYKSTKPSNEGKFLSSVLVFPKQSSRSRSLSVRGSASRSESPHIDCSLADYIPKSDRPIHARAIRAASRPTTLGSARSTTTHSGRAGRADLRSSPVSPGRMPIPSTGRVAGGAQPQSKLSVDYDNSSVIQSLQYELRQLRCKQAEFQRFAYDTLGYMFSKISGISDTDKIHFANTYTNISSRYESLPMNLNNASVVFDKAGRKSTFIKAEIHAVGNKFQFDQNLSRIATELRCLKWCYIRMILALRLPKYGFGSDTHPNAPWNDIDKCTEVGVYPTSLRGRPTPARFLE